MWAMWATSLLLNFVNYRNLTKLLLFVYFLCNILLNTYITYVLIKLVTILSAFQFKKIIFFFTTTRVLGGPIKYVYGF